MKYNVNVIEASAFMNVTPAVVRYRVKGLSKGSDGKVIIKNKIIAKVSRTELAEPFIEQQKKQC